MDAAALREFCHRERPPSVVMDNMFDSSQPPAADAIELDIGQEMTRSFGRVLDCEAILSTGVVTVYFAEDAAAQRCAAALNGGNFDGRRIGARYCAGGASRGLANGTSSAPGADEAEAADAASVGDATPPEAELGDTTGDEGESGDDGSCGSLAASLSDDDESDAGDVVSSLREHMLKATAPPPPPSTPPSARRRRTRRRGTAAARTRGAVALARRRSGPSSLGSGRRPRVPPSAPTR